MFLQVTAIYMYNIIFNVKRKMIIDWWGWKGRRKEVPIIALMETDSVIFEAPNMFVKDLLRMRGF